MEGADPTIIHAVDTRNRIAKVDGRYCHWVAPWSQEVRFWGLYLCTFLFYVYKCTVLFYFYTMMVNNDGFDSAVVYCFVLFLYCFMFKLIDFSIGGG